MEFFHQLGDVALIIETIARYFDFQFPDLEAITGFDEVTFMYHGDAACAQAASENFQSPIDVGQRCVDAGEVEFCA